MPKYYPIGDGVFSPPLPKPPVYNPTSPSAPNNNTLGANPGLVTSTGGLTGATGLLMTPFINPQGFSFVAIHNQTNFDCEEFASYYYPQAIPQVQGNPYQEGCVVNCNRIKLKYRELGVATFSINITIYVPNMDSFTTYSFPVKIYNPFNRKSFPDEKIHFRSVGISPVVSGERPQVSITRNANSGPISITSLVLCGLADETPQL
jgi:hypothetical protein